MERDRRNGKERRGKEGKHAVSLPKAASVFDSSVGH